MTDADSPRHAEWAKLYELLLAALTRHGVHDPFGDGDFYLVDDDYGSMQHKIECTSAAAFTPALAAEIQQLLALFEGEWEVIVALPVLGGSKHGFAITRRSWVEHVG